jgi:hypothetical protein
MALPFNPNLVAHPSSISNLAQAQRWVNRFPRPAGFNVHAWHTLKRLAMFIWKGYFDGKPFQRTLNFLHPSFYEMIRTPEGQLLIREKNLRRFKAS